MRQSGPYVRIMEKTLFFKHGRGSERPPPDHKHAH